MHCHRCRFDHGRLFAWLAPKQVHRLLQTIKDCDFELRARAVGEHCVQQKFGAKHPYYRALELTVVINRRPYREHATAAILNRAADGSLMAVASRLRSAF